MKDYYQILGVSPDSSAQDIKRSFRRLAVGLHPDKNSRPEAEAMFKEVNEAYEVLSDPASRAQYDLSRSGVSPTARHRDPAYRRREQAGYRYRPPAGPPPRMVFMASVLRYFRLLFLAGTCWSIFLLIDFSLPLQMRHEQVLTNKDDLRRMLLRRSNTDLLVTSSGMHFPLTYAEIKYFPHGSNVIIHYSKILSVLVKVESETSGYTLHNLASVYRNFSFAPIVLFAICLLGLLWPRGIEFRFNLGVVAFLLMLLNIVFLVRSIVA
jgi:curved DNA-binding protein CbpA